MWCCCRRRSPIKKWTVNDLLSGKISPSSVVAEARQRNEKLALLLPHVQRIIPGSSYLPDIGVDAKELIQICQIREPTIRAKIDEAAWKHINLPSDDGFDTETFNKLDQLCRNFGFAGVSDAIREAPHSYPV